jgi:hypothetical protein
VRETIGRGAHRQLGAEAGERSLLNAASAARNKRVEIGGGGRIDPRLFYFRALLEGDRFFSGGGRF